MFSRSCLRLLLPLRVNALKQSSISFLEEKVCTAVRHSRLSVLYDSFSLDLLYEDESGDSYFFDVLA